MHVTFYNFLHLFFCCYTKLTKDKMANFLVTGGAGFIASHLAERLAKEQGSFVVVADDLSTGYIDNIPKASNVHFVKCSVNNYRDLSPLFFRYRFDYVFHYAAVVGVHRTLQNPIAVLQDISGIKNVLDLSKSTGVKRIFYASSSEVYGESIEFPQDEQNTPLNSRLPYAVVKNAGEAFLRSYFQEYRLDYTIFRFFNTYGPRQNQDFVISKFVSQAIKDLDITINGNGDQTRTFCYIKDNIDATIATLKREEAIGETYNIGNDTETSISALAKKIVQLTNSKSKIVNMQPLKEGDMPRRKPDIKKMNQLLGRKPLSLNDGLKLYIEWYKKINSF
jgi:UDP-glucuronate decarboxylase